MWETLASVFGVLLAKSQSCLCRWVWTISYTQLFRLADHTGRTNFPNDVRVKFCTNSTYFCHKYANRCLLWPCTEGTLISHKYLPLEVFWPLRTLSPVSWEVLCSPLQFCMPFSRPISAYFKTWVLFQASLVDVPNGCGLCFAIKSFKDRVICSPPQFWESLVVLWTQLCRFKAHQCPFRHPRLRPFFRLP